MYTKELQNLANEMFFDKKKMISVSLNKKLKQEIEEGTKFLDTIYKKVPLKIRCLVIIQDIDEENFPKCPHCKVNPVSYKKDYNDGFNEFCSNKCSGLSKSFKVNPLLLDENYLYEERIVKKRSKESIAEELGCSVIAVNKGFLRFNIPKVKYNESEHSCLEKLNNPEWLKKEHKDNHRSFSDISEEIGSSKATLSRKCKEFDIEANSPNSYDRSFTSSSKECLEVRDFIQDELGLQCELNNRTILNGREIDIFIPDFNFGIEYNGIWCHIHQPDQNSYAKQKDSSYHSSKTKDAKVKGIKLIHIWSDDWKNKKEIWKSRLSNLLKRSYLIIYARKCYIQEITSSQKGEFLRLNHLQGNDCAKIKLGLFFNHNLIAVMTFCKSRYNKSVEWELSRFAVKMNWSIPGGFSKLLKYFRTKFSGSIISYSDNSYSDGNVYLKNGFIQKNISTNYWYVDSKKEVRLHRSAFMKKKIAPDDLRSEQEILRSRSIFKIYGAGIVTWILE